MSSAPAYTSPPRPRRHFDYRTCIITDTPDGPHQFMPEQESQVMCRLCQVRKQPFTTTMRGTSLKYCGPTCRYRHDQKRKAEKYAAERVPDRATKVRGSIPTRMCAHPSCGAEFTPACKHAAFCSRECRDDVRRARERAKYIPVGTGNKPRKRQPARICDRAGCGTEFTPGNAKGRYCSPICRRQAWEARKKEIGL